MEKHPKVKRTSKDKPLLIKAEYKAIASEEPEAPDSKTVGALSLEELIAKNTIGNTNAAEKRI